VCRGAADTASSSPRCYSWQLQMTQAKQLMGDDTTCQHVAFGKAAPHRSLLPGHAFHVAQPRGHFGHAILTLDTVVTLLSASSTRSTVCTFCPRNAFALRLACLWVRPICSFALRLAVRARSFLCKQIVGAMFAVLLTAGRWRNLRCAAVRTAERQCMGITVGSRCRMCMAGQEPMMQAASGCIIPRWRMAVHSLLRRSYCCDLSDRQPQFPSRPSSPHCWRRRRPHAGDDRSAACWPGIEVILRMMPSPP